MYISNEELTNLFDTTLLMMETYSVIYCYHVANERMNNEFDDHKLKVI